MFAFSILCPPLGEHRAGGFNYNNMFNRKEYDKKYREEHLEKRRAYSRKYSQEHPEQGKKYNQEHPEQRKEYQKKYRQENLEKRRKYSREYNQKNPNKNSKSSKENRKNYTQGKKAKYAKYKSNAKTRNYPFNLTFEQFITFWQKSCYYCGDEIETIGLDRVDNSRGYEIDNVVPCCKICNRMKLNMSKDDFINHYKKIIKVDNLRGWCQAMLPMASKEKR